jgi:dolichyl-phosphate beta-glucosyltransferase
MIFIKPDISIVIPAYREAKRLPYTMKKIQDFINQSPLLFEIIIVVEKSPDNTLEIVQEWKNKIKEIIIIVNEQKLGKGASVQKGMLAASGQCIGFIDADGSTELPFIKQAYDLIIHKKYYGVIASRSLEGSVINNKQNFLRVLLGNIYRKFTQYISQLPYKDTQCGCKFFHSSIVNILFESILEKGFAFDVEILIKAKKNNISIKELACVWEDKENSTVNTFIDGLIMLKAIFKLKKFYSKKDYS